MSMTYEELLQAMLDRVPGNIDKREGSVIYDALAPCAYFLAQQKFQIDNFVDLVLVDTAIDHYLDEAVAPFGITRKQATAAVRSVTASGLITVGTRWGINGLVYVITKQISDTSYEATCETVGEIGNQYSGALQPVSNVVGITATISDIITAGTDTETDEAMRDRLYQKVRLPATSGNAYHYQQWAMSVPGTGAAKVFPLDDGPGTVTVLVVNDDKEISDDLPVTVAAYIETVRPIGATVTVSSPETLTINVAANVVLDGSKTAGEVKTAFTAALDSFLKETIFNTRRVSYAKLGSLLLDIPGVEDFDGFLLNSGTGNVAVGEKQIPVIGTVTLTEVSTLGSD